MRTKRTKTRSGRSRKASQAGWLALLLLAMPAMLEAQERERDRDRNRAVIRLQDMFPRGMLGVRVSTALSDEDARGAELVGVTDNGPADKAGIRSGDVITSVGGQSLLEPLADADQEERIDLDRSVPSQRLVMLARALEPGEEVVVEYLRDGEPASATIEVGEPSAPRAFFMGDLSRFGEEEWAERMEELGERAREMGERARERTLELRDRFDDYAWLPDAGMAVGLMGLRASLGISVVTLNPGLARYFSAEQGALVTEADEENPFELQAGDVILAIDGRSVDAAGDVRRILRSYEEDEAATLRIMRDGSELEVSGTIRDQDRRRGAWRRGRPAQATGRVRATRSGVRPAAVRAVALRRGAARVARVAPRVGAARPVPVARMFRWAPNRPSVIRL